MLMLPSIGGMHPLGAHEGEAFDLAFAADGSRLLSSGEDGTVCSWCVRTRAPLARHVLALKGVEGVGGVRSKGRVWIEHLECSGGGTSGRPCCFIASAGRALVVADADAGSQQRVLGPLDHTVDAVAATRAGGVAAASFGGVFWWPTAEAIETSAGRAPRVFAYAGWLVSLAVSPDDAWIAAGCNDNTVRLWRTEDGRDLQCGGYSSKVSEVAFSGCGARLATSGATQATVWDFTGDGPAGSTPVACVGFRSNISAVAFRRVESRRVESDPVPRGAGAAPAPEPAVDEAPSLLLACASEDGQVKMYDVNDYIAGNVMFGKPHIALPVAATRSEASDEAMDAGKTGSEADRSGESPSPVARVAWRGEDVVVGCEGGEVIGYRMVS
jgi:WD40 repeat protein